MVLSHPLGPFRAIQRVRDRRVSLMLDFSAAEIEAVRLSLRIAFWAMAGSLPLWAGDGNRSGARPVLRQKPARRRGSPAAPNATCRDRLPAVAAVRPLGRFLDESFGIVFAFRSRRRCRRAEAHSRLDSAVIRRVAHRRSPGTALGPAPLRRLKPCSKSISSTASPILRSISTFEPDAA